MSHQPGSEDGTEKFGVETIEACRAPERVVTPSPGNPLVAFLPRLGAWIAVLAVVHAIRPDPALSLMLVALAGIVTIVSDARFRLERRLEDRGLPSREAWVPLVMMVVMARFDLIDASRLDGVVATQGPVLAFILSFALVSEGLRRSGVFHFLAYRLVERGETNMVRLTLYLFLLSSALAYFTSNDIVVLTMTPIVVSVAFQARIANAKLLLLSQFVAANTVSMGLLIGSPSNLILGRAVGLSFVEHFLIMLMPSAMALMGTFVALTGVNRFVARHGRSRLGRRLVGSWAFSPSYTPPRFTDHRELTPAMARWVGLFAASVTVLALGVGSSVGVLLAAVLIAIGGAVLLRVDAHRHHEPTGLRFVGGAARVLPFGIVIFGLVYFVIADAVAHAPSVQRQVGAFVRDHGSSTTPAPSWGSILAAGTLVNTMNDLPASALTGEVLAEVKDDFETPFDRILVVQGLLVGLNIATYVTPVGALAGIIWFDVLRKERDRRRLLAGEGGIPDPLDVIMPERRDLVLYGSATFLTMTAVLGATNFGFVTLADWLTGPPERVTFGDSPGRLPWALACLALALAVVVRFRRVLRHNGVALSHLSDLVPRLRTARQWVVGHRALSTVAAALLAGALGAVALYHIELLHAAEYGGRAPFDTPGGFVSWLVSVISSGYRDDGPRSIFGHVVPAAVALGAVAAGVSLARARRARRRPGGGVPPT